MALSQPASASQTFEREKERSHRAAESAQRVALHTRVAHMASAVHEHFGPGAKIIMKHERDQYRINGILGQDMHDASELDGAVGFATRIDFDTQFGNFDDISTLGFPDEEEHGAWRIPSRPAEDHLRPGMNLIESAQADDRDEIDIRRQLQDMEIYPYRVDFDHAGRISTWSGHRPCGSREDGRYDAEQAPRQTAAMQNVFDQHSDVTRTSLRWFQPEDHMQRSFKV